MRVPAPKRRMGVRRASMSARSRPSPITILPGGRIIARGRVVVPRNSYSTGGFEHLLPMGDGGPFPGTEDRSHMVSDPVFVRGTYLQRDVYGPGLAEDVSPQYIIMDGAAYEETVGTLRDLGFTIQSRRMPDGRMMECRAVADFEEDEINPSTGQPYSGKIVIDFTNRSGVGDWGFRPAAGPGSLSLRRR